MMLQDIHQRSRARPQRSDWTCVQLPRLISFVSDLLRSRLLSSRMYSSHAPIYWRP